MTDTGSGIRAGKVFPVPTTYGVESEHRRLLAEVVNHLAAVALTPYTQQIQIEDVDFTEAGADLGLTLEVTPYVPARAHVILVVQVINSDAVLDLDAVVQIQENGFTIAELENTYLASGGGRSEALVLQILSDLEPNTTYEYTVVAAEGSGQSGLAGVGSSLSVRLEPRIIATY